MDVSKHVSDVEFILLDRHVQAGFIILITGGPRQQPHVLRLCLAPEEAPPRRESRGWRGGSALEARLQGEVDLFGLEPRFYRSSASYLNFLFA